MTRDEVIAKIKKLLRLKHGGSPDEIAKAMFLAQQLAEKYGVELSSVNADLDADSRTVKHSEVRSYGRVPVEVHVACNVVKRHFEVDFIMASRVENFRWRYVLNVIGNDIERMLASHLAVYIARQMGTAWRTRRGRCRNKTAFVHGFGMGIDEAVARLRPPRIKSEALTLSLAGYLDRVFPKHTSGNQLETGAAQAAKYAGWLAGKNTAVHRPITHTAAHIPNLLSA